MHTGRHRAYVAAEPALELREAALHEVAQAVFFVKAGRLASSPPDHIDPRAEPVPGVVLWGPDTRKPAFSADLPRSAGPPQGSGERTRTINMAYSAYAGMQKQYPDRDVRVAIKRKPGRKLMPEEKAYNRELLWIRIRAEHTIRRVKIFRYGLQVQKSAARVRLNQRQRVRVGEHAAVAGADGNMTA